MTSLPYFLRIGSQQLSLCSVELLKVIYTFSLYIISSGQRRWILKTFVHCRIIIFFILFPGYRYKGSWKFFPKTLRQYTYTV